MNQDYNPSPYHNLDYKDPLENVPVTPIMIDHLRATKPWVRFISIILFISVGLMVLMGVLMMFMSSASGMGGSAIGPVFGIIYILFGGLYVVPAFFLHKYASSINDFLQGGGDSAMESALESQKSFWRFVGILTLVIICIYGLILLLAILGGLSAFALR